MTSTNEDDFVDAEIVNTEVSVDALSKIRWKMRDGSFIYVKDMQDSHQNELELFGSGYSH